MNPFGDPTTDWDLMEPLADGRLAVTIASETRDVAEIAGSRTWVVAPHGAPATVWLTEDAAFAERDDLAARGVRAEVRVRVECVVTDIPAVAS